MRFHLFYGLIIAALVGWIVLDKKEAEEPALDLATVQTLQSAAQILEKDKQYEYDIQEKAFSDYPSAVGMELLGKVKLLRKQSVQFQFALQELADSVLNQKMQTVELVKVLPGISKAYQDSLFELADHFMEVERSIPNLMLVDSNQTVPNWLPGSLILAKPAETQVVFESIRLRAMCAERVVLNYLSGRLIIDDFTFDKVAVCNSVENPAPKVGELYTAAICPTLYQSTLSNQFVIKVDGQELEVKDGFGLFSRKYTTPGVKHYTAEIIFTNPITEVTNHYKKEFSVTVVAPCK